MMVFVNGITLRNLSLMNVLKLFFVGTFQNLSTMEKKALFLRIDNYVCLLNICKMEAREKRKTRDREENYLGHLSFADELQHSFNEFIAIIISTFGYIPVGYN
jgi:hypothetical protein